MRHFDGAVRISEDAARERAGDRCLFDDIDVILTAPAPGRLPITGESSPYYLFHPLAGQRIATDLPGVKLLVLLLIFIWIRTTVPRLRYDQLMRFGWKVLLPVATINAVVTALCVVAF